MSVQDNNPDQDLVEAEAHARRLSRLGYVGGAVAATVIAIYAINFRGPLSDKTDAWGQFGDFVGGVLNPTFSFLALLALLATLGFQIKELRLSVRELKNSANALQKQNETLRHQNFEATFFQLLRLHNDIVTDLEVQSLSLKGRACFPHYLQKLEDSLSSDGAPNDFDTFNILYDMFYREHQAVLGHYFRLLYNVVKLVKQSDAVDKRFYTNLVRAQLSSSELKLLFYNCLSTWGCEKFKPLVEEFALLKTLPNDTLPDDVLLHAYSTSAFGGEYPVSWL